jgi:hypothetical protein
MGYALKDRRMVLDQDAQTLKLPNVMNIPVTGVSLEHGKV